MAQHGKLAGFITAAAVSAALMPTIALALPKEGAEAPNARVEDADGHALQMSSLKGKPILIVYEDKESSAQNQALKDDLSKLATGDKYKSTIALAAIADVSAYDFWPVKGFVKDAIRDESKKQKTTIYCDWDASFRKTYGIKAGASNIILIGKDNRILFAASGKLNENDRKKLITLLSAQVEG